MRKSTKFYDFINVFADTPLLYNDKRYYKVHRFQVADKSLAVLVLNSAWLCMGDEDVGKIALGERQVQEALTAVEDAEQKLGRTGECEECALPEAFSRSEVMGRRGIVILGDPGSGKTTHMKRILKPIRSANLRANTHWFIITEKVG